MNGNQSSQISSYLQYLPAILQVDPVLGHFLLAFERILSSSDPLDSPSPALEEYIDRISTYFNPVETPSEFLPWLAGWVALSLRDDWGEKTKRLFINQIVPLYRLRGTKTGLEKILKLYLSSDSILEKVVEKVEIFEFDNLPHYFQVQLTLPDRDRDLYWRTAKIAKAIIDREKPVHTFYALKILVPTMRLTGNFYPIELKQPGAIAATVNLDDASNILILSIKGSEQVEPYARQAGKNFPLTVTYTVTPEQFKRGEKWHLAIANLSSAPAVKGKFTVTITYDENSSQQPYRDEKFTLEPGLKIGKPPDGNTVLGTVTANPERTPVSPT